MWPSGRAYRPAIRTAHSAVDCSQQRTGLADLVVQSFSYASAGQPSLFRLFLQETGAFKEHVGAFDQLDATSSGGIDRSYTVPALANDVDGDGECGAA